MNTSPYILMLHEALVRFKLNRNWGMVRIIEAELEKALKEVQDE